MGFNHAEGEATGEGKPRPLPMQILDEATGYLIALGASAALWRQQHEGGSWLVRVSLAWLKTVASGFGELRGVRLSAQLARTPIAWRRPPMPPGNHPPRWP
ncbi:hypothetical protein A8M77_31400 [Variovorax sp. JS1663]|nr:hypothetical protein A8M77_31400 [Variovorax sp. JS1663]